MALVEIIWRVLRRIRARWCWRERVPIVSQKTGGVAPGESKAFRLPFDNIPESWNRMMPQLVIARMLTSGRGKQFFTAETQRRGVRTRQGIRWGRCGGCGCTLLERGI